MVSSGTEATMSAIRLARAFTHRSKLVKFDGCYHGHSDGLLVKAGSGVATLSLPDSPGVPASIARETLTAKYNDIKSVQRLFHHYRNDIAAVIVEPVCGNMGVILPQADFLRDLRNLTMQSDALLIFDEVITGFRIALGGAQHRYRIKPDLTCLGKILGGGLPLAAFGGRRRIMDQLAPLGPVYQAGTLSGNPLAVAAGIETLHMLERRGSHGTLEAKGQRLEDGLNDVIRKHGIQGNHQPRRIDVDFVLRCRLRYAPWTMPAAVTANNSPVFFMVCSNVGFICRPRLLRLGSSPLPTQMLIWTGQFPLLTIGPGAPITVDPA